MRTISEILGIFPDTKTEDWKQHGNGGGWVQSTVKIEPSVYVGENTIVSGNTQVYGDAWERSPLLIIGTAHFLTMCGRDKLAIGRQIHTIEYWQKHYREICASEGYSAEQIEEYGLYIELAAKLMARRKAQA